MAVDTTQSPYTVRDYGPDDEAAVVGLLRLSLGEGGSFARTAEFFRWKHLHNPFGASQMLLAAGGEMLGLRAFLRWRFRTPQTVVRAVRAVDTATHPGYRRMGIFSRLTKASLERARSDGVHLIYNTPNPQSMAGYLKLGWQAVGRPRLLVRVLNPLRLPLGALRQRGGRLAPPDVSGFFRLPPRSVEDLLAHSEHLERILGFDDELSSGGIRTDRSLPFLRWRYAAPPSPQYFALWTGATPLTGVLIFRPNIRRGLREIMLCEFLVGYGAGPHARELIAHLAGGVRADYVVAAATPGTQHWGLLRRAGFIPLPERAGPTFVVHPLNWPSGAIDPARPEHWRLSLGDLELF